MIGVTLGALAPLSSLESAIDMGASVSMSTASRWRAASTEARDLPSRRAAAGPMFAVIGDSTFAHSGLSGAITGAEERRLR